MVEETARKRSMASEEPLVSSELTEDEANLYDRQIRLWGLESQKRLQKVRVLIAGLNGLGAEVAKNLILAGIKAITLLDHKQVTPIDFSSQFMVSRADEGKNRAVSSKAYAQNLNPNVEVVAEEGDIKQKDKEYFSKFDIVCCTDFSGLDSLLRINTICRELEVKFICGSTWGAYGFFFTDLIQHSYTEEIRQLPEKKLGVSEAKKPRLEDTTPVVKKSMTFVPLSKALQVKAGKAGTGLDKQTSPVFLLLHVLLSFHNKEKRQPAAADEETLLSLREEVSQKLGVDKERIKEKFFKNIFGDMSPVCAVIGGVLAQEIIKIASCKDAPIKNFFIFDGDECSGIQENVGR